MRTVRAQPHAMCLCPRALRTACLVDKGLSPRHAAVVALTLTNSPTHSLHVIVMDCSSSTSFRLPRFAA